MPLQGSGSISLSQIGTEFGDSQPHSLSEFYAGGSAGVTSGGAPNVPSSGEISFDDFYGAANQITETASNNQTNINLSTVFGSNWTSAVPKVYVVPSGVTVGATSGNAAIIAPTNMSGTLVINISGSVLAHGGSGGSGGYAPGGCRRNLLDVNNGAPGGTGGDAINIQSANITINNNSGGQISGGGGGGGGGGTGQLFFQSGFWWNGGAGGTGGNGQGYNQSAGSGGSGGTVSCNGGYGGDGGNGGTFGNDGSAGNQGGNFTGQGNGYGGQRGYGGSGGSAGKAITSSNSTSWTNGTTAGTYHGSYT